MRGISIGMAAAGVCHGAAAKVAKKAKWRQQRSGGVRRKSGSESGMPIAKEEIVAANMAKVAK